MNKSVINQCSENRKTNKEQKYSSFRHKRKVAKEPVKLPKKWKNCKVSYTEEYEYGDITDMWDLKPLQFLKIEEEENIKSFHKK